MEFPIELLNSIAVVLEVIVAIVTALFVAFWIGLVVWTFRDIRSRTRDVFAWILATLLVLIAGPIGWLLYFLLRPRETLAQVYDRQLEEEALLRDITTHRACPKCQAVTEPDWLVCPHCRTALRRTCGECGRALELNWVICPYCTTPVSAKSAAALPPGQEQQAAQEPVDEESHWRWRPAPEAAQTTTAGLSAIGAEPGNDQPQPLAEGAAMSET